MCSPSTSKNRIKSPDTPRYGTGFIGRGWWVEVPKAPLKRPYMGAVNDTFCFILFQFFQDIRLVLLAKNANFWFQFTWMLFRYTQEL